MGVTAAVGTMGVVARYARRHPVTATFAGLEGHDAQWPDWSLDGLREQGEESAALSHALRVDGPVDDPVLEADRQVALTALALEREELTGTHWMRGNPSLWAGEAAFGLVSLLSAHDESRLAERTDALIERLQTLGHFLDDAPRTLSAAAMPTAFRDRARLEMAAVQALIARGVAQWADAHAIDARARAALGRAIPIASAAADRFAHWLAATPGSTTAAVSPGRAHFARVVRDAHAEPTSLEMLRAEATAALRDAQATLARRIAEVAPGGGWTDVQAALSRDAATPAEYLDTYVREWAHCADVSARMIPMPTDDFAVTFTPIPVWARDAQPALYYLFYRSPAPWRWPATYRYQVPPIDGLDPAAQQARLAQWNRSQIRLNHVVHHGCLGHHRQNAAQTRARGPMARLAAVDGACRLALHAGGTMAEGWSCYAVELYEEMGELTPLEAVAEQHTRVRILCRALADLALHVDGAPLATAQAIYEREAMMPAAAASAEAVKNAMFPGMAIMYWLGTRTIHAARATAHAAAGGAFDLRAWHGQLLAYGALPLPMVVQLMHEGVAP